MARARLLRPAPTIRRPQHFAAMQLERDIAEAFGHPSRDFECTSFVGGSSFGTNSLISRPTMWR